MSSDRRRLGLFALVLATAACADVRRGERWDEPGGDEGEGGAAQTGDSAGPEPASYSMVAIPRS